MRRPVQITIRSVQAVDGQPEESGEQYASGFLIPDRDGYLLSYQEDATNGMDGTETILSLQPERIVLTRRGSVESRMVFEVGKPHWSLYKTPYGDMSLNVVTDRAEYRIDGPSGRIEVEYALEIERLSTGRNYFCIEFFGQPPMMG